MVSMTRFFICLVLLSGLATASGQTPPKGRFPEPLEKYEMPPMYIYRLETSQRMISQYDTFTSYQVNVDANGNNIVGDAANEPSISVDPTNGNKMAIGWRQFNTWTSNFRQAGWGYTTDAGVHWTFPGVLQNNVFRSDPVTNSDETGNFFYLSLLVNTYCGDIWRSMNGGQSWTERSPDGAAHSGDKEWFTVDRTPASMGHGFQYQFWTEFFACDFGGFSRSTDGGATWQTPISIPNSPQWGTLDVASNGNLFIGGGDSGSSFWCIRSSNAQNPAVTPTFDQVTTVNMGGSLVYGGTVNPGGLAGQIFVVVDRSGGSTNNNIYMMASVRPPGGNGTNVMFARSTNGGASFSAPQRINDDPVNSNKWHWLGTLAVAPNGRIDSVWYDTRNAANNTDSQLFYSYSTDGGVTWSPNVAVSNSFNPLEGWPSQNKIGDYITIVSDNTGGDVAYAATYNFNPSRGQHEQDVYYVRVGPSAPVAQSAFSRKTHGGAGTFDVPLPLTGNVGVECRSGGGTNDYQMIINFATSVTVGGASVTSGAGSVSSFSVSGSQVTVNLTGVTNVQRITVTLSNVNDGTHMGNVPVSMGVLVGDVNGNAAVSAADVALTTSQVGATVSGSNFREDVNANGVINSVDVAQVKAEVGTALPP
ncbi:MAG: dockerin type I domain-containing protein [Chthoniobacterales bacterium]